MMNIWHDIAPERIKSDDFVACIEISKGGKNKYEMDKETGMLKLDRLLYTSTHYPANYGFIPRTYADDNDPLDVLVLCSEAILPMTLVTPVTWKAKLKVSRNKDNARYRASQLMPRFAHFWARRSDDGMAEAALIAFYGQNFGGVQ